MKKRPLPLGYLVSTILVSSILISASLTGDDKSVVQKESAADHICKIRNNQVTGAISPADYLKAMQQAKTQQGIRNGQAYNFEWNLLGPNNLGGRTRAILFDNRDTSGNIVYAGSVNGGIFRSNDGGAKWNMIQHDGNLFVTCLTQDGNGNIYAGTGEGFNVKTYTIFNEWGYKSGMMGQGIFKSEDGLTFNLLSSTTPVINGNNELEWGFINELAAHPANGDLYAATNTGLKYSGDGGNSWQVAKTYDGAPLAQSSVDVKMAANGLVVAEVNSLCYVSEDGNPSHFILRSGDSIYNIPADTNRVRRIEFSIAPSDNNVIYALAINAGGALNNVYKSEDKGLNWVIVGPGNSTFFNVFNTGSNTSQGVGLFAGTIEVFPDDPYHILIGGQDMWDGKKIQEDGFYQWVLRSTATADWLSFAFLWQGHHTYKFKPGSPGTFLAGTNGGISMGTVGDPIYIFQFMNKDYIASQFYTVGTTSEKKNVLGGAQDIGTILIDGYDNPGDSKRGNDIWTTSSGLADGKTGGYCTMSTIYPTAVIYSRYPQPEVTPEGFVRRNEFGGGPNWATNMLTTTYASTAFLAPFLLYENFEDYNTKDSVGLKITKNYPAGSVIWIESNNGKRPFKYITPVALTPGDSIVVADIVTARFFIGGDNRVLMTKQVIQFNLTPEWYIISDVSHGGVAGKPESMAYSSDANHLFVGTDKGDLYRISNIKYAYNQETADVSSAYCVISSKRIPVLIPGDTAEISQVITSIAVDPNNDNRVIITLGNYGNGHYVFVTDNALDENPIFRSAQGIPGNGGLPQAPAYSSLFEMKADNHLVFVGTEFGVYITNNIEASNPTWVPENNNLGGVPVFMLKQQSVKKTNDTLMFVNIDTTYVIHYGTNNYGVIYGATYGRGLISLDDFQQAVGISDPPKVNNDNGFMIYPNPANDKVTVAFELATGGKVEINIYNLSGSLVKSVDLGTRPEGRHDAIINIANLKAGSYVMSLTMGNQRSSSKFIVQ